MSDSTHAHHKYSLTYICFSPTASPVGIEMGDLTWDEWQALFNDLAGAIQ